MSDSKVLLFGSFTEDETKSLLVKKFSGRNEKPAEEKQLQFGFLNFVPGGSSGGSSITSESSNLLNSPKSPDSTPPSDSQKWNGVNSVSDKLPGVSGTIKENGSVANFSLGPSSDIGVDEVKEDNVSSSKLLDEDGSLNQFTSLNLDASEAGSLKNVDKNGKVDDFFIKLI